MKFSQGFVYYTVNGAPTNHAGIKTKITQILTNRALAYHMLNQQDKVLESTSYVLENLDPNNIKALMRRAFAYRADLSFELALKDLLKMKELMSPND